MNKKIFIIIFMMFLLVGSFSFVLAADSSGRLQIWRNASTDANVSWVDNNGNWNMVGNVTSSWFKGIFNWIVGSTSSNYLTFNGTQLDFSESAMNTTIDSRIVISEPDLNVNDSEYLDSYDSSFFMPLNTSVTGDFDFNGGWTSGGVSIIDGDFYGQTAYFYNITGLDVNTLKVNGSLVPQKGFDNQFDLGNETLRWRDLYLGGEVRSNGTGDNYFLGNVGIGTNSPSVELEIYSTSGDLQFSDDVKQSGGDAFNIFANGANLEISSGSSSRNLYLAGGDGSTNHMIIHNSGNIGIGNTTPANKLIVVGDVNITTNLSVGGTTFLVNSDDGRVGIGTTSPTALLDVSSITKATGGVMHITSTYSGSDWVAGDEIGTLGFYSSDPSDVGLKAKIVAVGETAGNYPADTELAFYTTTIGTAGLTEQMRIDDSGNVGIGTSSPGQKLDIDGGNVMVKGAGADQWIQIDSDDSARFLADASNADASIEFQEDDSLKWSVGFDYSADNTNPPLMISEGAPGTNTRLTILNGGNVGIGTSSPENFLHVNASTVNTVAQFESTDAGASIAFVDSASASVTDNTIGVSENKLIFRANGDERMRIDSSGNVGIGVLTPSTKLEINQSADDDGIKLYGYDDVATDYGSIYLDSNGRLNLDSVASGTDVIYLRASGTAVANFNAGYSRVAYDNLAATFGTTDDYGIGYNSTDDTLQFVDGSAVGTNVRMVIDNGGYVGIGTTDPKRRLHLEDSSSNQSLLISTTGNSGRFVQLRVNSDDHELGWDNGDNFHFGVFDNFNDDSITSYLSILGASGNVGIGNTTPASKLVVVGDANVTGNLYVAGNLVGDGVINSTAWNRSGTNVSLRSPGDNISATTLFVDNSAGRVGVGTVSPDTPLDIEADNGRMLRLARTTASGTGMLIQDTDTGSGTTNGFLIGISDAEVAQLWNYENTDMIFATNNAQKMVIEAGGNVGIGESNPDETLTIDLSGANNQIALNANANRQSAITFRSAGTDKWYVGRGDSDILSEDTFFIGKYGGSVNDAGGNTAKLVIDSSGNVGIGNTTPANKLIVVGDANVTGNFSAGGTTFLVDNDDGRVGIGTASPSATLHVAGTIKVGETASGNTMSESGNSMYLKTSATSGTVGLIVAKSNGGTIAKFESSGNVGIGTLTPTNLFNVLGDANITGNLYVAGNLVGDGLTNSTAWNRSGTNVSLRSPGDNISATTLFVDNSAGRVGVGTVSPDTPLDIEADNGRMLRLARTTASGTGMLIQDTDTGSGTTNGFLIGISDAEVAQLWNYENTDMIFATNNAQKMVIEAGGNVGIGESNPDETLTIDLSGANNQIALNANANRQSAITFRSAGTDKWYVGRGDSDILSEDTFFIGKYGGSVNDAGGNTAKLVIDSSGNVGIGNTTPANKLIVVGDANVTGNFSAGGTTFLVDNDDGRVGIGTASPSATLHVAGTIKVGETASGNTMSESGNSMYLKTSATSGTVGLIVAKSNGGTIAKFESSGNVGIGTLTPTNLFNVLGDANVTGNLYVAGNLVGDGLTNSTAWNRSGTNVSLRSPGDNISATTLFVDNSNGRVGIGTVAPSQLFQLQSGAGGHTFLSNSTGGVTTELVSSASSTNIVLDKGISGADAKVQFKTAGSLNFEIGVDSTPADIFKIGRTNNNADFVIDTSGNVGIGTTGPNATLEVINGTTQGGFMVSSDSQGAGDLFLVDEGGNVGIGTSSPSSGYKLDVVGNTILSSGYLVVSDSTWGINIQDNTPLTMGNGGDYSLGTDGSKSYWSVGTSLGSTTGITMDGSGNVGIGTTSPGSPLHVDSSSDSVPALRVTGGAGGVDMARFVRDEGANAEIKVHANSGEPQITWDRNSAGQLWSMGIDSTTDDFQIAEGASIGAGDVRMTFAEGGNVGIGTTSPSAELHVNSSGHTYSYISTSSGVSVAKLQLQNTADGTYGTISLDAGGLMHFGTEDSASTNHLVIDGSGQVGIGTASPSRELEINGTTDPSLLITDGTTELLLQAYTGNSGWIGTTTDDPLKFGANSSTRMTIDGAGSVGIGTVSPQNLLEIANANGAEMALRRVDTGIFGGNLLGNIKFTGDQDSTSIESASIRGIVNGNENWGAGDYPSDLQFWTTSDGSSTIAQRMVIRSSGNVGIGKGSPSSLLEVAGTFNASSNGGYVQVNSGGDVLIGI
mgnify:CR=1 FL=1